MDIDLVRRLNLKDKLIKQFTAEEMAEYRHKRYMKEKQQRLEYQKRYYQEHKKQIQKKALNRYRVKCRLGEIK